MKAEILDGKAIAAEIRAEIRERVQVCRNRHGSPPGLAVILVGQDPASQVYVRMKERACVDVGMESTIYTMEETTTEDKLLELVGRLNKDRTVHGILVQLPLPKQINPMAIIHAIDPQKDVDGFHPVNAGKLLIGDKGFVPCTPAGVIELIRRTGMTMTGRHAVVIGRSNIVGKPVSLLLLQNDATVTMCHSRTANLRDHCRQADILVAAVGVPHLVQGDWVKPGAVVIDVGVNRGADGKLSGDVDFEAAADVARYITPVPGGVGPMTIAMLLENTLRSAMDALA